MCKIGTFQGNLSTIFRKILNIYLFSRVFQKVEIIVMLRFNILQYFNYNEILEIFLTSFCNILCYVGSHLKTIQETYQLLIRNMTIPEMALLSPTSTFIHVLLRINVCMKKSTQIKHPKTPT